MFFEDKPRILVASLVCALYGGLLDVYSSILGPLVDPEIVESNELFVNSLHNFSPLRYFVFNGGGWLLYLIPAALFLFIAFRRYWVSSLPFWWFGFHAAGVGVSNVVLMLHSLFERWLGPRGF